MLASDILFASDDFATYVRLHYDFDSPPRNNWRRARATKKSEPSGEALYARRSISAPMASSRRGLASSTTQQSWRFIAAPHAYIDITGRSVANDVGATAARHFEKRPDAATWPGEADAASSPFFVRGKKLSRLF